ncbi:glutamate synthase [Candidatus Geothermarchaeota archaeon ex4572_27]|nr:MAG: glutamate synthase [Candidatus Geothermarchaeota archaeon ex4572_27]
MRFARCRDLSGVKPSGKSVGIIGAGPAGLGAAGELVCMGHKVVVYDMLPEPGGLLIFGIPEFRLPKDRVREGIKELERLGVEFRCGVKVGEDISLKEVVESHDAVLIATGTWKSNPLGIPGEDLPGVYDAFSYIINTNLERYGYEPFEKMPDMYGVVAVIGGGLTAIDACHVAYERGAEKVILLYRRTRKEAPAGEKEFNRIERELKVEIRELTQPVRYIAEGGRVRYIEAVKMRLGAPDKSGRPRPEPIPGSEHRIEVDNVLTAAGLIATPPEGVKELGIELTKWNTVKTDKKHRTTLKGVFAAGDVEHGPSLVGPALKSGKEAAKYIDEYLRTGEWGWEE